MSLLNKYILNIIPIEWTRKIPPSITYSSVCWFFFSAQSAFWVTEIFSTLLRTINDEFSHFSNSYSLNIEYIRPFDWQLKLKTCLIHHKWALRNIKNHWGGDGLERRQREHIKNSCHIAIITWKRVVSHSITVSAHTIYTRSTSNPLATLSLTSLKQAISCNNIQCRSENEKLNHNQSIDELSSMHSSIVQS